MIRIKGCLINGKHIAYIEKYGFYEICIHLIHSSEVLTFTYESQKERDAAFEDIDMCGRD